MRNLVIDMGNTRIKLGVFEENELLWQGEFPHQADNKILDTIAAYQIKAIIISNVSKFEATFLNELDQNIKCYPLNTETKLPFENNYASKATLGADRKALVAGAFHFFKGQNCLIIDAGTCVTYDILSKNNEFLGGNVTPGLHMRLRAMHEFTGKLPLPLWFEPNNLMGNSTDTCLLSGAYFGLIGEIQYFINEYSKQFENLQVLLSGGDASLLAKHFKSSIFVNEQLLLYGLNKILIEQDI